MFESGLCLVVQTTSADPIALNDALACLPVACAQAHGRVPSLGKKVAVYAYDRRWRRLAEEDLLVADTDHVRITREIPDDARPRAIKDLQLLRFPLTGVMPCVTEAMLAQGPVVALSPSVELSQGKALAQLAHGLMLLADHAGPEVARSAICGQADASAWTALEAGWEVADAGRTEIAPGTVTVRVLNRQGAAGGPRA